MPCTHCKIAVAFSILAAASASLTPALVWAQQPQRVALPCSGQGSASGSPYAYAYTYESVDHCPEFPGGDGALMHFINSERKYPREAYERAIEGRVMCSFVVESDGSISNIAVLRGVEPSLNEEAVRVISAMPDWKPGKVGTDNVPVYCILSIPFRL